MTTNTTDDATRLTDLDAAISRLSAVRKGYLDDPYAELLIGRLSRSQDQNRPPIINIGTHVRVYSIDKLIKKYLSEFNNVQIISLGAGSDTRFWRFNNDERISNYIEIDFDEVTSKKAMLINRNKELKSILGNDIKIEKGGSRLISSKYKLIPGDLREVDIIDLLEPYKNKDDPTIIISECVFVYMSIDSTNKILESFSREFKESLVIIYEMTNLNDKFGKVMISNLKSRGIELPGLMNNQLDRLKQCGCNQVESNDLNSIRHKLPYEEKARINNLELLDEIEELELILSHYSLTIGINSQFLGKFTTNSDETV